MIEKSVAGPELTGVNYLSFFEAINLYLRPKSYFEIGTQSGISVSRFTCDAVCVDPEYRLDRDVVGSRRKTLLYQMSSDEFFKTESLSALLPGGPNVSFLDGMHRFEYLLRDFINTERSSGQNSVVFIHDCLPSNLRMALRTHEEGDESEGEFRHAWTGDVWKIAPILKNYRPDLEINFIDCPPTGLVSVTGLDSSSAILKDSYFKIVEEFRQLDLPSFGFTELWSSFRMIDSRELMKRPDAFTLYFPPFL